MQQQPITLRVKDRTLDASDDMALFEFFSKWFIVFFSSHPWNEHLMCGNCKNEDDYGPSHAWGKSREISHCPECGTELTHFWSPERTRRYLLREKDNLCRFVYCGDEIAGWAYGFRKSPTTFYLDTIAALQPYRDEAGSEFFRLLREFIDELLETRGYTEVLTRTHREATVIRAVLPLMGFAEEEPSEEDPDRTFWRRQAR